MHGGRGMLELGVQGRSCSRNQEGGQWSGISWWERV